MIKKFIKKFLNYLGWSLNKIDRTRQNGYAYGNPNLKHIECILNSRGILHLGAHRGKEAEIYNWLNKKVIWVEAIPEIFEELKINVNYHYNQKAVKALLGEKDLKNVNFYISNKDQSCSSIFNLSEDVKKGLLWRKHKVEMVKKIQLDMQKLDTICEKEQINLENYDHWIVDLQGAELQALRGAKKSLKFCNSLSVEISRKNFYEKGSTSWEDLKKFLYNNNFNLIKEPQEDHCDVLFLRNN